MSASGRRSKKQAFADSEASVDAALFVAGLAAPLIWRRAAAYSQRDGTTELLTKASQFIDEIITRVRQFVRSRLPR
jgi:hypothetical protein